MGATFGSWGGLQCPCEAPGIVPKPRPLHIPSWSGAFCSNLRSFWDSRDISKPCKGKPSQNNIREFSINSFPAKLLVVFVELQGRSREHIGLFDNHVSAIASPILRSWSICRTSASHLRPLGACATGGDGLLSWGVMLFVAKNFTHPGTLKSSAEFCPWHCFLIGLRVEN